MYLQMAAIPIHFGLCYLMVTYLEWGIVGVGLANSLSCAVVYCGLLGYTCCLYEIHEAVFWPDASTCGNLYQFLEIGVPSALNVLFEWGAFEMMTVLAGLIGVT